MIKELFQKKMVLVAIITVITLYAAFSIGMGIRDGMVEGRDFQWDSAKVLALRIDPYQETISPTGVLEQYEYDKQFDRLEANQFPSVLWLLFPMTLLGAGQAKVVWKICNVLFAIGFLWGVRKTFLKEISQRDFFWIALIYLAGTPLRNCFAVGQHTLFALFFFVLSVLVSEEQHPFLGGILLSVSYFKYTLIVPIALYFIYKRWIKQLVISVVPHIILTLFTMWWLGKPLLYLFIEPLKITMWLTSEGAIDPGRFLGGGHLALIIGMMIGVFFLGLTIAAPQKREDEIITVLVLMSLILTYHRYYDFVILIIPVALMWKNQKGMTLDKILSAVVVFISFFLFSVFIHIWGLEGKEYDFLTAILAIVYYTLLIHQSICMLRDITIQRKTGEGKCQ